MDPITIVMFALIAVLIFFMFRNGKKRQAAMQQLQNGLRPGAEVMLQSGIYGTVESVDEAENRVTLRSGTSTLEVHRNAVSQIISPVEGADADEVGAELAPDDDPAFGERVAGGSADEQVENAAEAQNADEASAADEPGTPEDEQGPKA